jgi:RNA polymerase sigma factor (sigma-70 family)
MCWASRSLLLHGSTRRCAVPSRALPRRITTLLQTLGGVPASGSVMDRELKEYELALRARDGDRDALAQLVERTRLPLFQLAYADLRHYDDAQDAVAAALVQVCLHVGELRQPERIRVWMQSIVRNEVRRLRRGSGAATLSLEEREPPASDAGPSLLRLDIERALRRLPDEMAQAMRLFYLEDLSLDEVMRRTGRSKGTIASWLHRGRQQLATQMEGYTTMTPSEPKKAQRTKRSRIPAQAHAGFEPALVQTLTESLEGVFESISSPVPTWQLAEDERGNLWAGTGAGLLIMPASSQELTALTTIGRRIPALAHFAVDPHTHERRRVSDEPAEWLLVDEEHGLPHPQVRAFVWDARGDLWVGTDRGLARWDGASWRTFTRADGLCHDEIHALLVDDRGLLWVGTRRGLNRWDGASWEALTNSGLGGRFVSTLLQDSRGWIWVGTGDGGVSVFDGASWRSYRKGSGLTSDSVLALMEDSRRRVWVVQQENGISLFDGERWEHLDLDDIGSSIYCLLEDSKGRVWVPCTGSETNGVVILNLDLQRITYEPKGEIHRWNFAHSLLEDRRGQIWMGTDEGLSLFVGSQWHFYTPEGNLTDNSVTALVEDAEGRIWMGTYRGVVRYDHGRVPAERVVRAFTADDGLRPAATHRLLIVYCLLHDTQSRLWAGTFGGLHLWNGDCWAAQDLPPELSPSGVTALLEDDQGRIWVGTEQGLGVPDEAGWRPILREGATTFEDSSVGMGALLQDRQRRIWIGTRAGLTVFEEGEWRPYEAGPAEMAKGVSCLFEDSRGDLWVGGSWGVAVFEGGQWRTHRLVAGADTEDRRPLPEAGGTGLAVRAIAEDVKGRIWVGTAGGGVAVFEGGHWRQLGFAAGLSSLVVYTLLIDRDGKLWVGTHLGGVCVSTRPASELYREAAHVELSLEAHGSESPGVVQGQGNSVFGIGTEPRP